MLHFLSNCKYISEYQTLINSGLRSGSSIHISKCEVFHKFLCSFKFLHADVSTKDSSSNSFTVAYLKNSCGLSGNSLAFASKWVSFESSERPDSVLNFLRDLGVSESQIRMMIPRQPQILVSDAQKTLKPKIDFLLSIGFSETDVNKIISAQPGLLLRSLQNHLVPSFDFLKTFAGGEQKALTLIRADPRILRMDMSKFWGKNSSLQKLGVPKSQLLKLIKWSPRVLTQGPRMLSEIALMFKDMGLHPRSAAFVNAVRGRMCMSDLKWKGKFEIYRSLGFSTDEIHSMFKKQPSCMCYSEEKIRKAVEFFVNKLCLSPSKLSTMPLLIMCSLEKRIIPRCSVLQVLWSKNMITWSPMITTLTAMRENDFLQKYVIKYEEEVPEVLAAHQGKLKFEVYNFISRELEPVIAL